MPISSCDLKKVTSHESLSSLIHSGSKDGPHLIKSTERIKWLIRTLKISWHLVNNISSMPWLFVPQMLVWALPLLKDHYQPLLASCSWRLSLDFPA